MITTWMWIVELMDPEQVRSWGVGEEYEEK